MNNQDNNSNICPKCASPLADMTTTSSGRKLQRCSTGQWNAQTRQVEGCNFVKWLPFEPEPLDEKCPECGESLVLYTTANGKRMKKCSTAGWDKEKRQPTGCTYIYWLKAGEMEPPEILESEA